MKGVLFTVLHLQYEEIAIHGKCSGRDSDLPFTISSQCFGWSYRGNTDKKIAIKGIQYLSNIFYISLSSTFIITPIIKWEKILKKIF
jgi:predicted metalloprotease